MGRKFTVLLERDEDGVILATVPAIPGCHTQGKTPSEAMQRIQEAIELCMEDEDISPNEFVGVQHVEI